MIKEFKPRIFISYKKNIRRSYAGFGRKTIRFLPVVQRISDLLESKGHETFYDQHIGLGEAWFGQISDELVSCELVMLLLSQGTLQSHWVRSEVQFAEALKITIFPLGCGIDTRAVELELKSAGLAHIQGLGTNNHLPDREDALWAEIGKHISSAIEQTRVKQSQLLTSLLKARQARGVAKANNSFARFGLKTSTGDRIVVHLATGDLARFSGIDVIASSENNYMQMARRIDGKTVSGLLRELGSRRAPYSDALQRELDWVIDNQGGALPIPIGEVLVTSSGHPNGRLRNEIGARYILHVSSAEVLANGELQPLSGEGQIRLCVRNCFEQLGNIAIKGGIVSEPGTPQRQEQETAPPNKITLDSVLLPLFGVGRRGLPVETVAEEMALSLRDTISGANSDSYGKVRNIHIAVFFADDVEIVRRKFAELLGPEISRE